MSDWPKDVADFSPFGAFSTASEGSQVTDMLMTWGQQFSSATGWPNASLAMYVPIVVRDQITVYQLGWLNGSSVAGNIDAGIYDRTLARLVSAGSTAQSGTSAIQLVDIADTTLAPGVYYLAMSADSTSTNLMGTGGGLPAANYRTCGVAQQASALPLPSTATFAAMAQTRVPLLFGAIEGATF